MSDLTPADPSTPAVPAATEPAGPAVIDTPRTRKGLGVFALILGLLAFFGDLVFVVFSIVQLFGLVTNFDLGTLLTSHSLAALGAYLLLLVIVFWAGLIVGGLAVLFGLIAAISGRGRAQGIVGLILGLLVFLSHLAVGLSILGAGSGIGNLGN
jgi:hypothetical protein